MKISEIITDKYKLRIPPTVYYDLLADVVEAEEGQEPCEDAISRAAAIKAMDDLEQEDIERYCCSIPEGFDGKRAIEALQGLPSVTPTCSEKPNNCEDAISRQSVIDTTICEGISCNECSFNTLENGESGCLLSERVTRLPSVTPKQRIGHWIPVSERLPEVDEDGLSEWVLVTTKNIDKAATMYDRLCANSWLTECFDGEKVLAWQPLPEPYKAESED